MPITFAHAAFAVVLSLIGSLTSASAADMAHRSRLGAVFAEPTKVVRGAVVTQDEVVVVDPGYVRTSPRVAGYYGQAGDFHYRNYYGTPQPLLRGVLPTNCVLAVVC
ncbi:hypothetical protein FNL55_21305 [Tardiphaga sp. vice352]|uniref:hypothetical protein n=1 Tax=unclassified Tardiphaga TaxID=2631404 RepID=UPI001163EAC2|nr:MULTISPECIES: hypothetical protein [unclassified Tardiphaga]QDM18271.1 hypothetical protein FNL53_21820 [Tardiphaga sp. vice278]QDM23276.1 hypothetical protein FIU28_20620 [Tardiphaga sp. vice154]QDM28497.1 hypothetical protein FNL56_22060 [Tardiphaga sp. vice304]QDM33594.1 hypothetical protein FNL55_21305 [Tardiphaga sp. vice352]